MKRVLSLVFVAAIMGSVFGCSKDPAITKADASAIPARAPAKTKAEPKAETRLTIPGGTRLRVALIDAVGTDSNSPGDTFIASLAEPVIVDGKMVLEKGTRVRGRVVDVRESGRVQGRASIQLTLSEVERPNGKTIAIETKTYGAVAEPTKKRDAGIIAGSAGVGAAIGAITGGGKGAAIGAGIGGGAGTGAVLASKGKDIHYGPETRLTFTLSRPVHM